MVKNPEGRRREEPERANGKIVRQIFLPKQPSHSAAIHNAGTVSQIGNFQVYL